jgi:tRNA A-37 threonylcarbamoyl transferase component Bud32
MTRYTDGHMSADGPSATGSMPHLQAPSLIGEILDGRYRITRKLGEGGMGEVYAAEHVHIEKRFAIKLLRQEIVSNPEAVSRFRQEARSSSSIGHRNIISIEDFGQLADGRIYMCMELLNGAALNDLITQPQPPERLLKILIQTGHGLAAAHAKNIVHRDMKPENIFVTITPEGEDVPKILDFGIAKVAGNDGQNNLTRTGTIFGTPFYMAPEQALGNPVDARTDIYAMGVIMYEVFAGSLPFQGDSFMGILTQHITTEPEPVEQRAAKAGRSLPPGLADVIARCMRKDPAQRFQTMDDLVAALVEIHRGVAGAGMSSYMEAFPVSAAHSVQAPVPMTGAHAAGGPSGAYVAPAGASGLVQGGTGPIVSPSGLYPGATGADASALLVPPQKSKTGLVIAIVAVLAVVGGVIAVVLSGGKGDEVKDQTVMLPPADAGVGSSDTPHTPPADAGPIVGQSDTPTTPDAGTPTEVPPPSIDAGVAAPPAAIINLVARNANSFEIWEGGQKLMDGPAGVELPATGKRQLVIKAPGFKDYSITLDAKKDAKKQFLQFSLTKLPSSNTTTTKNNTTTTTTTTKTPDTTQPSCTGTKADLGVKGCHEKYCAKHPNSVECMLED